MRARPFRIHADGPLARHRRGCTRRHRLFLRLDDLYPGVWTLDPEGGVGIREWQNNLYYVAWDADTKR